MLKETSRYASTDKQDEETRKSLTNSRLPPVEELTLGLKQKLHLQARARAAPYYIRKQEPVDLVERLLEERALVAEAVRRLQALQAHRPDDKPQSYRKCSVDS
ncbi:hypothetical protein EVAR_88194_1 [Eumeta japonica]|uniref:Uncharacterized protein n=1 Tax=Eumeta variegata TaxID=151549 RepID=A0A4C1WCF7_EUMVA|nr:hypothetical protein EVAR_88194_1 [Eumeta japonica]